MEKMKEMIKKMPKALVFIVAASAVCLGIQLFCVLVYAVVAVVEAVPAPVYVIAALAIAYKILRKKGDN